MLWRLIEELEAIQRWSAICRVCQKFLLCISSQCQDLYSHQKLNMYITGSHLRAVTDANDDDDDDDDDDVDNVGHHSTTTRATYRQ